MSLDKVIAFERVMDQVRRERARQDVMWGEQNHDDAGWNYILGEEYGEVQKALCENHFDYAGADPGEIRKELIETAAVAIAWVEAIDRRE